LCGCDFWDGNLEISGKISSNFIIKNYKKIARKNPLKPLNFHPLHPTNFPQFENRPPDGENGKWENSSK
jgi:hypothetical protein